MEEDGNISTDICWNVIFEGFFLNVWWRSHPACEFGFRLHKKHSQNEEAGGEKLHTPHALTQPLHVCANGNS